MANVTITFSDQEQQKVESILIDQDRMKPCAIWQTCWIR